MERLLGKEEFQTQKPKNQLKKVSSESQGGTFLEGVMRNIEYSAKFEGEFEMTDDELYLKLTQGSFGTHFQIPRCSVLE